MYKAVVVHGFAGSFTQGLKRHGEWDVQCQLETFNLGQQTVEERLGVPFIRREDASWPRIEASAAFGHPRCTAFSCLSTCRGAFAKQTVDIVQLSEYAAGHYDTVVFESVQQAYTTGRPLLEHIIDTHFKPKHYRIAHVLLNAASFGNSQARRRYFFVAYRDHLKFNITPPVIEPYYRVLWDDLGQSWLDSLDANGDHNKKLRPFKRKDLDYDENCYTQLTENEWHCIPRLPNGWGLNMLGRYDRDALPPKLREKWDTRISDMPFSLHCPYRANWFRPCPTIHSSSARMIHPEEHRPLTIGELAKCMGWEYIPTGPLPIAQIAKGIVPAVGTWIAEQVRACLDGDWGNEDWESKYDAASGQWVGRDTHGELEKTFHLTNYHGQLFDLERYPLKITQRYKLNIDPETGRLRQPWKKAVHER